MPATGDVLLTPGFNDYETDILQNIQKLTNMFLLDIIMFYLKNII